MASFTKLQKVQYENAIKTMRAVAGEMVGERASPSERQLYEWH